MGKDQTTTPGTPCPTLCDECVGSLTYPADHNSEDAGDGAYGLSSLSEKAYNVGPGHYLPYDELSFEKQEGTGLKLIQLFSPRMKEQGTVLESTRPMTEIFSCGETGCALTFKTEAEADAHMDSGQHVRDLESESGYDTIRKKWTEKIFGVGILP